MRLNKWMVAFITAFLLLQWTSRADDLDVNANQLCIHNGGEYWIRNMDHTLPQNGGGRYFPSFCHWAAKGVGEAPNITWPWKIRGWTWMAVLMDPDATTASWHTCLQKSKDAPYSTKMTWPYPLNYILGVIPATDSPAPFFTGTVPTTVDILSGNLLVYPSSAGGVDSHLNILAAASVTMDIPSLFPMEAVEFALILAGSEPSIEVPSSCSIYEYVWENKGANGQYLIYSGNETDNSGLLGGNKGKSYSVAGFDVSGILHFPNDGTGSYSEWAMSLLVEDAVSIPVNNPGVTDTGNPFAAYGFDVGVATITPVISQDNASLQMMSLDFENPGTSRVLIAGSPWRPAPGQAWQGPTIPYGIMGYRVAHAWDVFTYFFSYVWGVWAHTVNEGYPSSVSGLAATGGHSVPIHIPRDPILISVELKFSSFSLNGRAPSASFMTTFF